MSASSLCLDFRSPKPKIRRIGEKIGYQFRNRNHQSGRVTERQFSSCLSDSVLLACRDERRSSLEGVSAAELYSEHPGEPTSDHSAWNPLLQEHVDVDGWVDYQKLSHYEAKLEGCLDTITDPPFDEPARDGKLTLLINGYNAPTLKLIAENLPIGSIMDIAESKRWDDLRSEVGGN